MFVTEKMIAALNAQVGHEFANALQYVAIANWFESEDLRLLAKFYHKQSDEERGHAMKISQFLIDSGAKVEIPNLGSFVNSFSSAVEAAQLAFDAEVRTTNQIHDLVALAQSEKSPSASQFLQWFVEEQVEEIATAQRNLNVIKKSGNNVFLMEAYLAHNSE
jgi:ferritin